MCDTAAVLTGSFGGPGCIIYDEMEGQCVSVSIEIAPGYDTKLSTW